MGGGTTARFNSRLRILKTELSLALGAPKRQVRSEERRDKKSSQPLLRVFPGPAAEARVEVAVWPASGIGSLRCCDFHSHPTHGWKKIHRDTSCCARRPQVAG